MRFLRALVRRDVGVLSWRGQILSLPTFGGSLFPESKRGEARRRCGLHLKNREPGCQVMSQQAPGKSSKPNIVDRPISKGKNQVCQQAIGRAMTHNLQAALVYFLDASDGKLHNQLKSHFSRCHDAKYSKKQTHPEFCFPVGQVSLSAFCFLFSELVQYHQQRGNSIPELEKNVSSFSFFLLFVELKNMHGSMRVSDAYNAL
jgi:hypothetical protein